MSINIIVNIAALSLLSAYMPLCDKNNFLHVNSGDAVVLIMFNTLDKNAKKINCSKTGNIKKFTTQH